MFLLVRMPFHCFLYKQNVDIIKSLCDQDLMRAGSNLTQRHGKTASFKCALSCLRKILATETPLKMMKNALYFI